MSAQLHVDRTQCAGTGPPLEPQDPRTFEVVGALFSSLAASAQTRLVLARGERDAMMSTAELRLYCQDAHEIAVAGHNAHVEKPEEIVGLLERLIQK